MRNTISLILICVQLSSCSFHSSQYEFFREFLSADQAVDLPVKTWALSWINESKDLYAINAEEFIIFADQKINILYKENQIVKIIGLLSNDRVIEIRHEGKDRFYLENNFQLSRDSCKKNQIQELDEGYKRFSQICLDSETGDEYENQVMTNPKDELVELKFKVHPFYPLLKLSLK